MWKNPFFVIIAIAIVMVAGMMDLKYRGLFFRLLPAFMQNYLIGKSSNNKKS